MEDQYALFIYNPMLNSTTFAATHKSKEALIIWAQKKFHENLMFSVYKFIENGAITSKEIPITKWRLDTKFDGKKVDGTFRGFNQPMETAYCIEDVWYFKTM